MIPKYFFKYLNIFFSECVEYGKSNIQKIRIMGLIGHKPREVTIDKCRHKAIPLVVGELITIYGHIRAY